MCYSSLAETDFKKLNHELGATPWEDAFGEFRDIQDFEAKSSPDTIKSLLGLSRKPQSSKFRYCDDDGRFYPNWFAPVIIQQGGDKCIAPMRYRVRPGGSAEEVPTKYNMYNAKVESLLSAHNWRRLVGRNHAVVVIRQFYEYVNKVEIGITPTSGKLLNVAAIYDEWTSPDSTLSFRSFAIITGPPPVSVQAIGHHRCPITLTNNEVDDWLSANNSNSALALLNSVEKGVYEKAA